ncbi:MAG: 23S rRNA (adenine(2503)-C(2))-methyltransferase RlmN [Pseudomonadota bacterium]
MENLVPDPQKADILGLARNDLKQLLKAMKQPAYRGDQVFDWIWHRDTADPEGMTNLPLVLRRKLKQSFDWSLPSIEAGQTDRDGTTKLVLGLSDGLKVECVLIPRIGKSGAEGRAGAEEAAVSWKDTTLCVSTQVGCRFRCVFCRSGRDGLKRDLRAGEIASQLLAAGRRLPTGGAITRIVLMGIGEPLDNFENSCRAVRVWLDNGERAYGGGRIVVSTVGIRPALARLTDELGGKVGLALSLHAASAVKRKKMVGKAGRENPAGILEAACGFTLPKGEKLTVENVLVGGLNDSQGDARDLASLLEGKPCMVNLIPLNPAPGMSLVPPPADRVEAFQNILKARRILTFIRRRRGGSIQAACGQLAFGKQ